MSRARSVAIAILLAVVVATGQSAAAADAGLVFASQNDTESELQSGELTGLQIDTSGDVSAKLFGQTGTTATTNSDNTASILTGDYGIVINPNQDIAGVVVTLTTDTASGVTVELQTQTGAVIDSTTASGGSATLNGDMDAGQDYRVVVVANGDSVGSQISPSFPYTSSDVDIVAGVGDGAEEPGGRWAFDSAQAILYQDEGDGGTYVSSNHSADRVAEGVVDLDVSGTSATVEWQGWDGSSWTTLTSDSYSTSGEKTASLSSAYEKYRVNVSFAASAGATGAVVSEGVRFNAAEPEATNLAPSDGTKITQSTVNFSVDVGDADFGTAQGDEVQATLYVNGTAVGSENVTSNQTVSVTHSLSKGGNVSYHWELTDSYGDTATTATQTLTLPAELEIIDEENETLIDNAEVRLKFYLENDTDTRVVETTTSNGTVDFAALDLPADEPFIVTASADGYLSRRIYVPSLFDQQRVYLLNETATHRDIIFELRDFSGQYPESETVLLIQRSINGSYQTVQSDFFGATGEFTAQLAYNERHRLILLNTNTGERRALGPFTPLTDSRSVLKITQDGEIRVLDDVPIVRVAPSLETVPATASTELSVEIVEQATAISDWRVTATYVNGSTSTELANISSSEASSPVSFTVDLSNRTAGSLWVNTSFTLVDGTTSTLSEQFTVRQYARNEHSLLNVVSGVTALIPAPDVALVTTLLSLLTTVGLTVGIASSVSIPTESVGAIAVASLMGFGVLGWISYQIPFVAGVTLLAAAGLRRGI